MILTHTKLLAIRDSNGVKPVTSETDVISTLLAHIQAVEDETRLRYRVGYEVYRMTGASWARREVIACYWHKPDAEKAVAEARDTNNYYKVSPVHLIRINHKWHRINVTPYPSVEGEPDTAAISRLDYKHFKKPDTARVRIGNLFCNIAQILDAVKQEWVQDGSWSDFDQGVRDQISEELRIIEATK